MSRPEPTPRAPRDPYPDAYDWWLTLSRDARHRGDRDADSNIWTLLSENRRFKTERCADVLSDGVFDPEEDFEVDAATGYEKPKYLTSIVKVPCSEDRSPQRSRAASNPVIYGQDFADAWVNDVFPDRDEVDPQRFARTTAMRSQVRPTDMRNGMPASYSVQSPAIPSFPTDVAMLQQAESSNLQAAMPIPSSAEPPALLPLPTPLLQLSNLYPAQQLSPTTVDPPPNIMKSRPRSNKTRSSKSRRQGRSTPVSTINWTEQEGVTSSAGISLPPPAYVSPRRNRIEQCEYGRLPGPGDPDSVTNHGVVADQAVRMHRNLATNEGDLPSPRIGLTTISGSTARLTQQPWLPDEASRTKEPEFDIDDDATAEYGVNALDGLEPDDASATAPRDGWSGEIVVRERRPQHRLSTCAEE